MSSITINMSPIAIILWVLIIAVFVFFWWGGKKNKKNYKGQPMEITKGWYETSQTMYDQNDEKKAWFFQFDKNYLTQGHLMVDQNHQPVYEAKILYGDPVSGYEADFINHVINYKSHHNIGAVTSTGMGSDHNGIAVSSYFKFDGKNIWDYLADLGYTYRFSHQKLAYWIDVTKDGQKVGTIYSSNNGKNYFGCQAPYTAKMGGKGLTIVECAEKDMDAMFLYAMAFAKTELSLENLK